MDPHFLKKHDQGGYRYAYTGHERAVAQSVLSVKPKIQQAYNNQEPVSGTTTSSNLEHRLMHEDLIRVLISYKDVSVSLLLGNCL